MYRLLRCRDNVDFVMFKRRRGAVVKCAALIASFWLGFAVYANTVARWNDDGGLTPSAVRTAHQNSGAEVRQPMPRPPTAQPHGLPAGDDDPRVRRDRELQERFRRDQTKLQALLDGRKTPVAAPPAAVAPDLQKYDPQTASLIRLGLIVPKWNLSEEHPEHLGAPGNVNWCCVD